MKKIFCCGSCKWTVLLDRNFLNSYGKYVIKLKKKAYLEFQSDSGL